PATGSMPRAARSASLAGLVLVLAVGLSAQSTGSSSGSQNPTANTPTAQSAPQSTPASTGTPAAQPAPGTTPVGGDQAAPQDNKQTAQQPAQPTQQPAASSDNPCDTSAKPGTAPVGGDAAPPPCAEKNKKDKKDKDKNAKDKKNDDDENVKVDPDKVVEPGSDMVKIKPGSIEDVGSVGERDIGKRGMGNWYSTESEIKMGKEYADELEKSARFITDPVIDEYVNRIGQNIVKNSDCKVPFTIKVIDSDEINAFALPGGFFYVNSGLILNADEEAELAGVMAHETAHVCAHHAARQMTRSNWAQLGTIPLIIMAGGSWTGYGIYEAASFAVPM